MEKVNKYSKKILEASIKEMGEVTNILVTSDGSMYLEFENGMNIQIHQDEIQYQATQYLKSELEEIKI